MYKHEYSIHEILSSMVKIVWHLFCKTVLLFYFIFYFLSSSYSAWFFILAILYQIYNFMGVLGRIYQLFRKIRQVGISGNRLQVKLQVLFWVFCFSADCRCILGKLVLLGNSWILYTVSQIFHSWYASCIAYKKWSIVR